MALHFIEHHKQEELAQRCMDNLRDGRAHRHPFDNDVVVVQSAGLGKWLQLEQARLEGVSAGLWLPFARRFISDFLAQQGYYQPKEALEASRMQWLLFELFINGKYQSLLQDTGPLNRFLQTDHCSEFEKRCWEAADHLAHCLDQYAIYRPHWLQAWLDGHHLDCEA